MSRSPVKSKTLKRLCVGVSCDDQKRTLLFCAKKESPYNNPMIAPQRAESAIDSICIGILLKVYLELFDTFIFPILSNCR